MTHTPHPDPIAALADYPADGVLALITGVDGPSYRPLGAQMALLDNGDRIGTLSSGCIEQDIALHAKAVLASGQPETILYGRGSPFIDIQLPCGGGLEILLVPRPDETVLRRIHAAGQARTACTLAVDPASGQISMTDTPTTGFSDGLFQTRINPELFFYVFGKGPEAATFATLVQSAGYPNLMLSPDQETIDTAQAAGSATRHLKRAEFPKDIAPDMRSAIVLFFHDHEWEPPILRAALDSDAFYIGAQGSRRARDARVAQIAALGATPDSLARLKGPIGLVPSARDARTLAVSVLAEVLNEAQHH